MCCPSKQDKSVSSDIKMNDYFQSLVFLSGVMLSLGQLYNVLICSYSPILW